MLDFGAGTCFSGRTRRSDPFVVVGGPCVYNPEPLADVFDMAVIGEGEEVLVELLNAYREWKNKDALADAEAF